LNDPKVQVARSIRALLVLRFAGALGFSVVMADRGGTGATFSAWGRATPALSLNDGRGSAHMLNETTSYLVGRDGRVRYWHLGELDWSDPQTLDHVEELLGKGAPAQTGGRQQESNLPGSG
jgi:hypothetical protein